MANRGEAGTKPIANGGAYWHSDITYKAKPPMGSILYALEVLPAEGDTLYCDMGAAYESLPASTKMRIAGLRAVHGYLPRFMASRAIDEGFKDNQFELSADQKAELAEVVHPMVRTHPESGRKALFINEGFTLRVDGMDEAEGRALLDELNAHATQEPFIYRHGGAWVTWSSGTIARPCTARPTTIGGTRAACIAPRFRATFHADAVSATGIATMCNPLPAPVRAAQFLLTAWGSIAACTTINGRKRWVR